MVRNLWLTSLCIMLCATPAINFGQEVLTGTGANGRGTSTLVFYRWKTLFGRTWGAHIVIDGQRIGSLPNKSYFEVLVEPGEHDVWYRPFNYGGVYACRSTCEPVLMRVEAEEGRRHYFELIRPKNDVTTSRFHDRTEEEAQRRIRRLESPVEPDPTDVLVGGGDWTGFTELQEALINGEDDAAEALISQGVDVNERSVFSTAINVAAELGNTEMVELLLSRGAVTEPFERGPNPLSNAIDNGHAEIVRVLLDAGADVDAREQSGETPLFHAALAGDDEIVDVLLSLGADVNARAIDGRSPLHAAATANSRTIVQTLMTRGAIPEKLDSSEAAIVSSAHLFDFVGELELREGNRGRARDHYLSAADSYADAAAIYRDKEEVADWEFKATRWANILRPAFAAGLASMRANSNTVITPDGQLVGIGVATYEIEDLSDPKAIREAYALIAREYEGAAGRAEEVASCLEYDSRSLEECASL